MSGDSGLALKNIYGLSVRPEPVSQKSLTENVADIINEVVFPNPSHYEGKEKIVWVKFDQCDINDLSQYNEKIECNGNIPPFLLIIGYTNGVQIWVVQATGVAVEVLSFRQGPVRTVKILMSPETSNENIDKYSMKRPIAAICDSASPGTQFHSVEFLSLSARDTQPLKTIKFKSPVQDIHSNRQVIVISFAEKLAIFEATTFDDLFTISTCYKSPGLCTNPIALGDQWLAFADRKLHNTHQSCGGVITESSISYKSSVISVVKGLSKGLKDLGGTMATNFMGTKMTPAPPVQATPSPATTPGVVTIINTCKVTATELNLAKGPNPATIAHFVAHQGVAIVCMEFDSSGTLLATADKLAHNFNIFKLFCHPSSSSSSSVHHLYSLYRGDTTAKVLTMTFSLDSRWMAVATHRGTSHIYPIAPYGGTVSMRTHKSLCVVNKLSRFQRSAGLDDHPSSGRNSPVLSSSPGTIKIPFESSPNVAYHNPFYPPYPSATIVRAIGRIRQPDLSKLLETYGPGQSPTHSPPMSKASKNSLTDNVTKVSLSFGTTRGWIAGSPTVVREIRRQPVDSLFVMGDHGYLIEYILRVKPHSNVAQDKIRDDEIQLELDIEAYAQWPLLRESSNAEIRQPLHSENPLLASLCAKEQLQTAIDFNQDQTNPEEKWMAQVEIQTYTGPNRRLWMGPQYSFKTVSRTGNLASVDILECPDPSACDDDPSLEYPPRSSPVNIGSNLVYIEARSHSNSVESDCGEYDKIRIKHSLKEALADAMNDVQNDIGPNDKEAGEECSYDMSDVMDITCDPVGPSTDYPIIAPLHFSRSAEEELQAVTSKLRQVAVTNQSDEIDSHHWGSRTPSLGECRGITSSGEDFDLHCSLEPPLCPVSADDLIPLGQWTAPDDGVVQTSSWGPFVVESNPSLAPPPSTDSFPLIGASNSKSATTSEDDLWSSKESKKDRKRRRKRATKEQDAGIDVEQTSSFHAAADSREDLVPEYSCFDVDVDHFHTAEEFPAQEPLMMESIHEDPDDLQRALEEASSDESNQPVRVVKSDSRGAPHTGGQADEMFPFRETSSDEDDMGGALRVRRRPAAMVTPIVRFEEEEDDRETSGDDRKTTSESDVTTSPNPRLAASSKNKKKKKKKK